MLPKTITYTDYNGVERTETFYFNLSKSELTRWAMSVEGGLHERLQRIIDAKDNVAVMREFDNIIARSYGVKSDDGRRFMKSEKITEEFMQTPAYDQLYMDLITGGTDVMSAFINGIVPMDLVKEADAEHKAALSVVNPV
jgi:hypothetical protein